MAQLYIDDIGISIMIDPRQVVHTFRMRGTEQWFHLRQDLHTAIHLIYNFKIADALCNGVLFIFYFNGDGYVMFITGIQGIAVHYYGMGVVLSANYFYKFRPVLVRHQRMMQKDHGSPFI